VAETRGSQYTTGTLDLNASLALHSDHGACDPGSAEDCAEHTIVGAFPGLGQVTGKYTFLIDLGQPSCSNEFFGKGLAYPARLSVAAKGAIDIAVADGAECVEENSVRTQAQTFRVTGGTGMYVGATGGGTLKRTLGDLTDRGRYGKESWTGTLNVSGLEFQHDAPDLLRSDKQNRQREEGREGCPRELQGHGTGRR
jgi:hypothetical protein